MAEILFTEEYQMTNSPVKAHLISGPGVSNKLYLRNRETQQSIQFISLPPVISRTPRKWF